MTPKSQRRKRTSALLRPRLWWTKQWKKEWKHQELAITNKKLEIAYSDRGFLYQAINLRKLQLWLTLDHRIKDDHEKMNNSIHI